MTKGRSTATKPQSGAKITPLWIVAAFVTLTETVLGYAVTQVTGGVQVALTIFVIVFAPIVAGAFFLVLWHRPYVFYPPSEYDGTDPEKFIDAVRGTAAKPPYCTLGTVRLILQVNEALRNSVPDLEKRTLLIRVLFPPLELVQDEANLNEEQLARKLEQATDALGQANADAAGADPGGRADVS